MTTVGDILTPDDRGVIRRYFISREGGGPSIYDGFHLRRWEAGPKKGEPRLSTAVQGMLGRGLIVIDSSGLMPRAIFTNKGFLLLKRAMPDKRSFDLRYYWQLHAELAELPEME